MVLSVLNQWVMGVLPTRFTRMGAKMVQWPGARAGRVLRRGAIHL